MRDDLRKNEFNLYPEENIRTEYHNIVVTTDLSEQLSGARLNLTSLVFSLPFQYTEYEPEQFPGLIYKNPDLNVVYLIFSSGRCVITGSKTFEEALKAEEQLKEDYPDFIEDNYLHFAFNDRGWMHWPEYCLRIYRNLDYIRWVGEIHESIQGCKAHLQIEPSEEYAILHEKSISKQLISDEYYNTFEHHRNLHQKNLENRKRIVEAKLESIRFNSEQGLE